jgi:hypothetical protein
MRFRNSAPLNRHLYRNIGAQRHDGIRLDRLSVYQAQTNRGRNGRQNQQAF